MDIILDFDGTITAKDTIGDIATSCLSYQRDHGVDLTRSWDHILQQYMVDNEHYKHNFKESEESRTTLDQEIAFLRGRKEVEETSDRRVEVSGLFNGIDKDYLFSAGKEAVANGSVQIRPGFKDFIQTMTQKGWTISIMSVNWSASFIHGAISEPDIDVVANEISPEGRLVGPELLKRHGWDTVLVSSADKLHAMQSTVEDTAASRSFYFGDSTTDLECLVSTNGVVMSDDGESSLLQTLRRLGYTVRHVKDCDAGVKICWARNFQEVLDSQVLDG